MKADLNSTVVWTVSNFRLTSNSSCLLFKIFGTIPSAPTTTGIIDAFIYHNFFSSLPKSIFLRSFIFTLCFAGMTKSTRMVQSILQGGLVRYVFLWWHFFSRVWFEKFSCSSEDFFFYCSVIFAWFFPDLVVLFLSLFLSFHFSLWAWHILLMQNYIPRSWLYILINCKSVSSSYSFLSNILISSIYIRWFIFSCDFVNV